MRKLKKEIKRETEGFKTWNEYQNYARWLADHKCKSFTEVMIMCTFIVKMAKKRHINITNV